MQTNLTSPQAAGPPKQRQPEQAHQINNTLRGICPACRRPFSQTKEELLHKHGRGSTCAGSNQKPAAAPSVMQSASTDDQQLKNEVQSTEPELTAPDKYFGLPIQTVHFLPRELVPLAAERLAAALQAVAVTRQRLRLVETSPMAPLPSGPQNSTRKCQGSPHQTTSRTDHRCHRFANPDSARHKVKEKYRGPQTFSETTHRRRPSDQRH